MSETPRTDALDAELGVTDQRAGDAGRYRKHARQLERELNEVKGDWHRVSDERDQLKSKLFRTEDERDQWRTMAQELAEQLRHKTQISNPALTRFNELKKATPMKTAQLDAERCGYERGLNKAASMISRWFENNRLHPDIPNDSLNESARTAAHSVLQQAALSILEKLNESKGAHAEI